MEKRPRNAEDVKRRQAARVRFRKLVRTVLLNMHWLTEPEDNQQLSLNVKKNVQMLARAKPKFGLLTMAQKALIRTPHWSRSVEERKKLCTILAKMACLAKYPPKLRARLVPFIKFLILKKDQTIMKEGDFPITVYFIITGEVEMSKIKKNPVSGKREKKSEAIFGPGDCIGDVDLLEDDFRSHTFTAASQCELLVLFDNDCHKTLTPYMAKVWKEKKAALKSLSYFTFFNSAQTLTACKFGHIKQYNPLDVIFSEDKDVLSSSYSYFVLSGECVILQSLHMKVQKSGKNKVYELAIIEKEEEEENLRKKDSKKDLMRIAEKQRQSSLDVNSLFRVSTVDEEELQKKKEGRQKELKDIERLCGINSSVESFSEIPSKFSMAYEGDEGESSGSGSTNESENRRTLGTSMLKLGSKYSISSRQVDVIESDESEILTVSSRAKISVSQSQQSIKSSIRRSKSIKTIVDEFETHFIDVGSLTYGAMFGLGENIDHRVIMARTTVQCLLIPRFWLYQDQQNPGNMWNRHCFYMDFNIPTREKLFKEFCTTYRWANFKKEYVQSILIETKRAIAKPEDLPIFGRILEDADD